MAFVPPARHLLRAKDLADARYSEPLDVDDMAGAAGLSRAHFSREFRRTFGEPPHSYLLRRRLERAADLLRTTDRSVADIWNRQLRWARLRRATFAPLYALELVSGGFLPLAMAATLIVLAPPTWPGFVMLFITWYAAELLLADRMRWPISPRIALMMFVRDLALPTLWIAGWTGNTFVWRGNAMDMKTSQLAAAPTVAPQRSLADHALALRIRGARVVRSFRSLGAPGPVGAPRSLRPSPSPRWTWKTGKTR